MRYFSKDNRKVILSVLFVFGVIGVLTFQNCAPSGGGGAFNLGQSSTTPYVTPTPGSSPTPTVSPSPSANYESMVLGDSPKYFWPLNSASGSAETDVKAANNGTGIGTFTTGQAGGVVGDFPTLALSLSSGGYMDTNTQLNISAPVMIEIWFKTSGQGRIMGWGDGQTGTCVESTLPCTQFNLYVNTSNQLAFGVAVDVNNVAESAVVATAGAYDDGKWHYAVGGWDLNDNIYLYVDGAQVAAESVGFNAVAPVLSTGYWRVGPDDIAGYTGAPASPNFTGLVEDAAVYGSILTATQIQNHYNAGITP